MVQGGWQAPALSRVWVWEGWQKNIPEGGHSPCRSLRILAGADLARLRSPSASLLLLRRLVSASHDFGL